jgi:hypothetical protein
VGCVSIRAAHRGLDGVKVSDAFGQAPSREQEDAYAFDGCDWIACCSFVCGCVAHADGSGVCVFVVDAAGEEIWYTSRGVSGLSPAARFKSFIVC